MSKAETGATTRRDFVKSATGAVAATALLNVAVPHVHAAEDNTIRVALVGCGGRGTGAAANALSVKNGPIKLVAMADVFPDKLNASYQNLSGSFAQQVDAPEERRFIGFDGYRKALDCLRPGDVAIFATPPAFRWVHFGYAIEKGLHTFMEKPVTVDGPSTRKMLKLGEESVKKNLKVGVGLMCRHCDARTELHKRVKDGEIGDVILMRAYRMHGPLGSAFVGPKPAGTSSELLYQIRNFHAFLWASGGCYSDFYIHNIDECCWMKDAWPVKAQGIGGRHYRGDNVDQNFDHYAVEYTFADGAKLLLDGRNMGGCHDEFASYAHGSKGAAIISTAGHAPAKCRIYKGQNFTGEPAWKFAAPEPNPYQLEWNHLIDAIRSDLPYNEVKRGAEASLVTSMGRMASHTGRIITFDEMLAGEHELGPGIDKLTMESPSPLVADASGKYPVPQPGITTKREYA